MSDTRESGKGSKEFFQRSRRLKVMPHAQTALAAMRGESGSRFLCALGEDCVRSPLEQIVGALRPVSIPGLLLLAEQIRQQIVELLDRQCFAEVGRHQ